ncbi:RNA polymerase II-associated protein 1, partial [Lecanoromycetidae sp. Uapishka_2]
MAIRGERFRIDLDSDGEPFRSAQPAALNLALVGDIKERISSSDPKPPSPPRIKSSQNGFPAHKTRVGPSKFKQRRENGSVDRDQGCEPRKGNINEIISSAGQERNTMRLGSKDPSIDQENKQRLAQMSEEEIAEARQELISGLSPSLIEKLLKKANINDEHEDSSSELRKNSSADPKLPNFFTKHVTFEEPAAAPGASSSEENPRSSFHQDASPSQPPSNLQPASQVPNFSSPKIHFPNPPKAPDLDPSDPNFLSTLHSTYFPSLPADPSAMAWMAPLDPESEKDSAYAANEDALLPSELRFDFRGHLLPPRLSSQIPVTKGLHHHAHAPSSAGYTIPELAYLARSTYPAQRCIAYQTLGRILYRLGGGEFGLEEDVLSDGLWRLMDEGKVIQGLTEAAAREEQGNRSVWVTATEAVWLWRKGGGKKWRGR